jgi:diguanylate cyclase (GGDEF)-like protein
MIPTTADGSSAARPAVPLDRDLANERLIDRMMLTLASGVMALVLAISVSFHLAGSVRFAPAFYVTTVSYLAVAIVCAWSAPRLYTMRDLERLRWTALVITTVAMLSMSYFLGGANWIGVQPLFFLMFGCTFTPNHWRALIIAAAGIGGFVALAALEGTGLLPHQDPLGGALDPLRGAQLAATVAYTSVALALFGVLSGVISVMLILQRDALSTTAAELQDSKRDLEGLNADLGERVAEKTRELEERYRELHVMAEIGKIVNQSLDIDNVYLAFMDEVRKLVPFDQAAIAVFTRDRTAVRLLRGIIEHGAVSGASFALPADRALTAQRAAQIIEDFSKEGGAWVERDYILRHALACGATVPIFSHDVQIGTFNVASKAPGTYDARLLSLLERAVEPLALAIENARLYDEMRAIADTDGLTGLPNRRSLERALEHEIARAVRHGDRCSVLVMDIDNFKSFNDSLGHHAGDEMLVRFAVMLRETCRETDVVGRQSGDEFTVILPETSSEDAFALAQRIHDAMKRSTWQYPGDSGAPVTTSIGVATYPHDGESSEAMLSQADSAMYVAKAAGGGQTRLSSDVVKRKAA